MMVSHVAIVLYELRNVQESKPDEVGSNKKRQLEKAIGVFIIKK